MNPNQAQKNLVAGNTTSKPGLRTKLAVNAWLWRKRHIRFSQEVRSEALLLSWTFCRAL